MYRNQWVLWYGFVRVISTEDALCGSHAFQHDLQLFVAQTCALSQIPGFIRISWHAFSTQFWNTSKSLIGAEYIKVFRCPHSQKSRKLISGNHAGHFTGPRRPVHCPPEVWFRCCLTMRRRWDGAPACTNHVYCRLWRGTCSNSIKT
jgi:hypothetical protein